MRGRVRQPEGLGILGFISSFQMPGFCVLGESRGEKGAGWDLPVLGGWRGLRRVPPGSPPDAPGCCLLSSLRRSGGLLAPRQWEFGLGQDLST